MTLPGAPPLRWSSAGILALTDDRITDTPHIQYIFWRERQLPPGAQSTDTRVAQPLRCRAALRGVDRHLHHASNGFFTDVHLRRSGERGPCGILRQCWHAVLDFELGGQCASVFLPPSPVLEPRIAVNRCGVRSRKSNLGHCPPMLAFLRVPYWASCLPCTFIPISTAPPSCGLSFNPRRQEPNRSGCSRPVPCPYLRTCAHWAASNPRTAARLSFRGSRTRFSRGLVTSSRRPAL